MQDSKTTWEPDEIIKTAEIALSEVRKYDQFGEGARQTYTGQLVEKALFAIKTYKEQQ